MTPACGITVDGSQMTVVFHVNNRLVSHKDPRRVTEFLRQLNEVYRGTSPSSITSRGKCHEYLGMTIDLSMAKEISIYNYVQKLINRLSHDMIGVKPTAALEYLFETNDGDAEKLGKDKLDEFHTLRAIVLYLSQRTRPDLLQLALSFLCTWVKAPDVHD